MNEQPSSYTISQDVQIARPKATKALPVSYEDLAFIKRCLAGLKAKIDFYLSAAFFFMGISISCLFQAKYGTFPATTNNQMSGNEMFLWMAFGFSLLLAGATFFFCHLRHKDNMQSKTDLEGYIDLLESKFEK